MRIAFTKEDYDKETKTITVTMDSVFFMGLLKHLRTGDRKLPPGIIAVDPNGKEKVFTDLKYYKGYSIICTNKDLILKIADGL